jgi:hypothetical protein
MTFLVPSIRSGGGYRDIRWPTGHGPFDNTLEITRPRAKPFPAGHAAHAVAVWLDPVRRDID